MARFEAMIQDDYSDQVGRYFRDIDKFPLLSEEEERKLALQVKAGDQKAREKLINSNLRFVVKVAKENANPGMSFLDLVSEGNIGLIKAVDKFDPSVGTKFVSYAVFWIRQSILKAIQEKSRLVRLPANKIAELVKVKRAETNLSLNGITRPTEEELADESGVPLKTVKALRIASEKMISINDPVSNGRDADGQGACVGDFLADTDLLPEDKYYIESRQEMVRDAVSKLPERQRMIIEMRFGLDGYEEMSLSDIGDEMNLTKERVRQLEKDALVKLRDLKMAV